MTGRHERLPALLRRDVERTRDPSETLRTLWSIDHVPYPVDLGVARNSNRPSK